MQASIIQVLLSKKHFVEKIKKLVNESKEMNEASLDASLYQQGNIAKFLEDLPEYEFVKLLQKLPREIQEEYSGDQDLENQDATNYEGDRDTNNPNSSYQHQTQDLDDHEETTRGDHGANNSNGPSSVGFYENQTQDLGGQNPNEDADNHGPSGDVEDLLAVEKEKKVKSFGDPHQPATGDMFHHADDIRGNLSSYDHHDTSKGQGNPKRKARHWEFPSQEPPALNQRKDSKHHQLRAPEPVPDVKNEKLSAVLSPISSDDSSSSGVERITESDEESSLSSNDEDDRQPDIPLPTQAVADDNREVLRAREHVYMQPLRRFRDSEQRNAHRRSVVQDAQQQLPEQSSLQRQRELELWVSQLTETQLNYSKAAVMQANRETLSIQGTCSSFNALQQENDELKEQLATLEQEIQALQEHIATCEDSLRNKEHEISHLNRCRERLLTQIAAFEEALSTQNEEIKDNKKIIDFLIGRNKHWQDEYNEANRRAYEESKDDKKIIDFLIERNKHWQDEYNEANRRAYEFAQKMEEEQDTLRETMTNNGKAIEEIYEKFLAAKEENKILKDKLKQSEDKWKEKALDDREASQVQVPRHRASPLRALQQSLGLSSLFPEDMQENDHHEQHEDVD